MIRRLLTLGVFVAAALAAVPATPAGATTASLTCPTLGTPTVVTSNVRLEHDLTCAAGQWVVAPGVTVDLGGHTVTMGSSCPIEPGVAASDCTFQVNGTLRNGHLAGAGVRFLPGGRGACLRIDHAIADLWGGELAHSVVTNGLVGVESTGSVLTRSFVIGGQGVGLFNVEKALWNFRVTDNIVVGSSAGGIHLSTHFFAANDVTGVIEHNLVFHSTGPGISLVGDLADLGPIAITGNLVTGNSGSGIVVTDSPEILPPPVVGGPVTLTGNRARFNGGHGIDAGWASGIPSGVVDGGHNRASHNALAPPCIGVAC